MKKSAFIISIAATVLICLGAVSTWQWVSNTRSADTLKDQNAELNKTIDTLNNQISHLTVQVNTYGGQLAEIIGTPG